MECSKKTRTENDQTGPRRSMRCETLHEITQMRRRAQVRWRHPAQVETQAGSAASPRMAAERSQAAERRLRMQLQRQGRREKHPAHDHKALELWRASAVMLLGPSSSLLACFTVAAIQVFPSQKSRRPYGRWRHAGPSASHAFQALVSLQETTAVLQQLHAAHRPADHKTRGCWPPDMACIAKLYVQPGCHADKTHRTSDLQMLR